MLRKKINQGVRFSGMVVNIDYMSIVDVTKIRTVNTRRVKLPVPHAGLPDVQVTDMKDECIIVILNDVESSNKCAVYCDDMDENRISMILSTIISIPANQMSI